MSRMIFVMLLACVMLEASEARSAPTLGSKEPGLFNLKGVFYFLEPETQQMPDSLERMSPQGVIYAEKLDVPPRDFYEGLPGVTGRFEWFGIVYTGNFQITTPGTYRWRISSDDGTRLWIDGVEIISNDGIHGETSAAADLELSSGDHTIKVWYLQGPAQSIALQLFITPPGGEEKIFSLADYATELAAAIKRIQAEPTERGIRVRLDAAQLFDPGNSVLKPTAHDVIAAVAQLIGSYPGSSVRIEGYTDAAGNNNANQKLSLDRAEAVKAALVLAGVQGTPLETAGLGKAKPIASNKTESGRAQNRRLEIYIRP